MDSIKEILNISPEDNFAWIGHDAITGGAAIISQSKFGGTSVVFHHMDYSNYYYLKRNSTENKISVQKSVLKEANIVFAVGPRLLANAKKIRKTNQDTYEFIPGTPNFNQISPNRQFDYRIAICGRLDEENDLIKNISSGVKAAHKLLSDCTENSGAINLIGSKSEGKSIYSRFGLPKNVAINEIS